MVTSTSSTVVIPSRFNTALSLTNNEPNTAGLVTLTTTPLPLTARLRLLGTSAVENEESTVTLSPSPGRAPPDQKPQPAGPKGSPAGAANNAKPWLPSR